MEKPKTLDLQAETSASEQKQPETPGENGVAKTPTSPGCKFLLVSCLFSMLSPINGPLVENNMF